MSIQIRLLIFLAALALATGAWSITVDGPGDGALVDLSGNGSCELREAVAAANGDVAVDACPAGSAADVIDFDPAIGVIDLNQGQLLITEALTINGPGSDALSIRQMTPDARLIEIDDGNAAEFEVSISGLALTGGSVGALFGIAGSGGAILSREDLSLDQVELSNNAARNAGAILTSGTLLITRSKLLDSSADTGSGVLVCEDDASCRIEDTQVRGAASVSGPPFGRFSQSTVLDLIRSELSEFSAAPDNHALIVSNVVATIENVTYSDPEVSFLSVEDGSQADLVFSTIAGANADVFVSEGSILNIRGSILEGRLTKGGPAVFDPVVIANFSVFADPGLDGSFFNAESNNFFGLDPQLRPLRNNGGPTRTHDLALASPARDRISLSSNPCDAISIDQRGLPRPYPILCDAGAVEAGSGTIFADGFEN